MNKSLRAGIKIESEHNKTYIMMSQYVKKYGKMPPKKAVFGSIAKDHIKELGNGYYPNLILMERKLKRRH